MTSREATPVRSGPHPSQNRSVHPALHLHQPAQALELPVLGIVGKERHAGRRPRVGGALLDLGQDDLCDEGQVKAPRLLQRDPLKQGQLVAGGGKIVEVGPRDGLQNEKQDVSTTTKRVLIEMLADSGLTVVEATSFVNPKAVPQMADAHELFTSIAKKDDVSYPVLVPNVRGLEQALDAGVEEIAIFVAASQLFSEKNIGCSIEKSFDRYADVVKLAHEENLRIRGYVSCVLGCPYEGSFTDFSLCRHAGFATCYGRIKLLTTPL